MCILLLIACSWANAQRQYLFGVVQDSSTSAPMIDVNIQNISSGSLTSSNELGKFRIPAKASDTIVFSSVGYATLAWTVKGSWFEGKEIAFLLPVETVYLQEVVVGNLPTYVRFKEKIIELQPVDTTYKIFGVEPVIMKGDPALEESYVKNPFFAITHPIDFVHQMVSKKQKQKRTLYQMEKTRHLTDEANLKFTQEWVAEMTGLEGDSVLNFMFYCGFTNSYLANTPRYLINERMAPLLKAYRNGEEREKEKDK